MFKPLPAQRIETRTSLKSPLCNDLRKESHLVDDDGLTDSELLTRLSALIKV